MDSLNSGFLNSNWLIKMLEKSSKTPRGRLLNLFNILEDWLEAPIVKEQLEKGSYGQSQDKSLQDYLTLEATKAGAAMPEILAHQLYFMAVAAAQEKLQSHSISNSSQASSFNHAMLAASALISAQTQAEFNIAKPTAYAMAASFLGVCIVASSLFVINLQQSTTANLTAQLPVKSTMSQLIPAELTADPQQTAALIAQMNQMRSGNCQLIEAIQLPDSQKGIYLNMVVNGQVSTNPKEQAIAFDLLRKTRCNYAPMLMANSTN